jgi:AraC-like DNA-binding protein
MAKNMDKMAIRERFDYIPAARERTWGVYVTGVGRQVEPKQPRPSHNHPLRVLRDYCLIYITDGHGSYKGHDSKWRRVQEGDVLALFPGIRHDYYPSPKTGWTARWVLFNGELANHWCMHDLLCVDTPVLRVGLRNEVTEGFDRLLDIARVASPFSNQIQAGVVMEILAMVLKFHQDRFMHSRQATPIVEASLGYIRKNWGQEISFELLAKQLGVGYRNFRRLFQEATGVAPHQYLLNFRLNQAKRLLGTLPVAEVAARVGFSDSLYFSRLFKRKVGVAPSQWR